MNEKLIKAWSEADKNLGKEIDIGDIVVCDSCNEDYTDSDAVGGFLFASNGICPKCAPEYRADVEKYQEQEFIRAEARPGETFKSFVLRMRGGNNKIKISSW